MIFFVCATGTPGINVQSVNENSKHPVSTAATILWEDRWQRLIPKADLL